MIGTVRTAPLKRSRPGVGLLASVVAAAVVLGSVFRDTLARPAVASWTTVFVAVAVQALPFLALGVTVSGAIAAFVPPGFLPRLLPKRPALAVPIAACAGAALPGCECGSVPIASRLVRGGVPPAAAMAFLLSAPAINPVVLVATAVAFPNRPMMVLARFLSSLIAATVVGLVWSKLDDGSLTAPTGNAHEHHGTRLEVFIDTAQHDLLHAGGFLVVGAATAATLQTVVPRSVLDHMASTGLLAVAAMAGLAVILAVCSEADAFVAAGLTQFSLVARLAFLTVGPMVDVKLVALQIGSFGRRFATRFAPLTFAVAVASALLVGWWLL